jgi:subtilisin family serine protease
VPQLTATPEIPFPPAPPDPVLVAAGRQRALARLLPKARDGRLVPVIVGFDSTFVPEGRLSASGITAQHRAIAAGRAAVLAQMPRGSVSGLKAFDTIPYFAAFVDADALQTLAGLPDVTSITEDRKSRPMLNDSTRIVQADRVWAAGVPGVGGNVAVLDTGVDKTHEMFAGGKVVSEACYSTTGGGTTSTCPGGSNSTAPGSGVNCNMTFTGCDHGTHVAGIAAGSSASLRGVAPGAGVIAIQVFSYEGTSVVSWTSDQILALQRVLALSGVANVAAANMSLGGSELYYSDAECDADNAAIKSAIDNLRSVNVATVIASGNDGFPNAINAPGCISTAVAVGSTTKQGTVSNFSNMAVGMVELLAPGSNILSAVPGVAGAQSNRYSLMSGTSMATPHVAGMWVLLKIVAALRGDVGAVATLLAALRSTGWNILDRASAGSGGTFPEVRAYDAAYLIYTGGGTLAPGAPSGLVATSSGSSVQLRWNAPTTGGAPTSYTIEAGSAPGLSNLANFATGNTATSFAASGIGAGTYYVRVRATNSAGASAASNEATLVVGAAGSSITIAAGRG